MQKFLTFLIKALLFPFSKLPLKVHYALARPLAWIIRNVARYRYDDVQTNLARCFPDCVYWGLQDLSKDFYRHFADIIVETIWFGGCRNTERLEKAGIVRIVNPDEFNFLYDHSPSLMVMYSHCGNWELLGGIPNYSPNTRLRADESSFCVVYKKMSSAAWDTVMRDNRFAPLTDRRHFAGYIESKDLVRYAFTHRDEKKVYNINTDQRPYYTGSDVIKVDFMGRRTGTMSAAAALAHKFGMAVTFQRMRVESRGHYTIEYVTICEDASKMTVQQIMDRYYELLDDEIREQPWNYLWSHRRWLPQQ